MNAKIQNNTIVNIGDYVCFKADYEMQGKVIEIEYLPCGGKTKRLTIQTGGSDPQYQETYTAIDSDCWTVE